MNNIQDIHHDSTSSIIFSSFLHALILFTILSALFILVISQLESKAFKNEINDNIQKYLPQALAQNDKDGSLKKVIKNLPIDNLLMKELLKQQNKYMEAQKNIYELQKEIDVEEVKSRYQALDLNNAQIKVEELTAELENMEHLYKKTRRENWIGRGVSILYLIYLIFYNIYFA